MSLEHEHLTQSIIGAAITVHRTLGPGFLESVYESALVVELTARDIPFERQASAPILYRGAQVGLHRIDLIVASEIVVELKSIRAVTDVHFAVVRSQLRALGRRHGLLLNFSGLRLEVRRVLAQLEPNGTAVTAP